MEQFRVDVDRLEAHFGMNALQYEGWVLTPNLKE
jgi:hypothetical protein